MIEPIATGTKTVMSINVHAEGKPGRIMLSAHLLLHGAARPIR